MDDVLGSKASYRFGELTVVQGLARPFLPPTSFTRPRDISDKQTKIQDRQHGAATIIATMHVHISSKTSVFYPESSPTELVGQAGYIPPAVLRESRHLAVEDLMEALGALSGMSNRCIVTNYSVQSLPLTRFPLPFFKYSAKHVASWLRREQSRDGTFQMTLTVSVAHTTQKTCVMGGMGDAGVAKGERQSFSNKFIRTASDAQLRQGCACNSRETSPQ